MVTRKQENRFRFRKPSLRKQDRTCTTVRRKLLMTLSSPTNEAFPTSVWMA